MTALLSTEGSRTWQNGQAHAQPPGPWKDKLRAWSPGLTCAEQEIKADSLGKETSLEEWDFPV